MAILNQSDQLNHDLGMIYTKRISMVTDNNVSDINLHSYYSYITGAPGAVVPITGCELNSFSEEMIGAGYIVKNADDSDILLLISIEGMMVGSAFISVFQCFEVLADGTKLLRGADLTRLTWEDTTTNALKLAGLAQNVIDCRTKVFETTKAAILLERNR